MEELSIIKDGDVGIVRRYPTWNPMSWISAAVRLFTGSRWNHAVIFINTGSQIFIVEAIEHGVVMCPYNRWKKKYKHNLKVIRFKDPIRPSDDIVDKIISHLGKPYDFTALLKDQVIFQVARWFGYKKWFGRTDESGADEKIYCSELIALVYNFSAWWTYTSADLLEIQHDVIFQDKSAN